MFPPTINLPPDCGKVTTRSAAPGRADAAVAVCSEVYVNESAERSVERACRHLVEHVGVRLVAVETADTGFDLALPAGANAELPPALSAGVFWFIRRNRRPCRVVGLDAADERGHAERAMADLNAADERREAAFDALDPIARVAEEELYPAAVRAACAPAAGASLGGRVRAVLTAERALGLAPGNFPQLAAFDAALALETRLDRPMLDQIDDERRELLSRLTAATDGAGAADGNEPDVTAARRCLRFWATTHRTDRAELEHHMRAQGVEVVLGNCNRWVTDWLVASAERTRDGELDPAELHQELVRLALCLEVDVGDLRAFREYAAYTRMAAEIDAMVLELELSDARRRLARACGPEAVRLFDLRERLQDLRRALACELTPRDAETVPAAPGVLAAAAAELAQLAGIELAPDLRASVSEIDRLLAASREYTERNLARGANMAARAIRHLRRSRDDRMLIVAGGFHARTITRALERDRTVSWYGIMPTVTDIGQRGGAYINKQSDEPVA